MRKLTGEQKKYISATQNYIYFSDVLLISWSLKNEKKQSEKHKSLFGWTGHPWVRLATRYKGSQNSMGWRTIRFHDFPAKNIKGVKSNLSRTTLHIHSIVIIVGCFLTFLNWRLSVRKASLKSFLYLLMIINTVSPHVSQIQNNFLMLICLTAVQSNFSTPPSTRRTKPPFAVNTDNQTKWLTFC